MKAIVIWQTGDVDVMKYETQYPVPELGSNQVIIKNEYAGVNFIDTYYRSGLYKRDPPFILGQEGGGTIAAVSEEAAEAGYKIGDRVVYMEFGSYAAYTAVPFSKIVPVPDGIEMDTALACMLQGLTAHYLTTSAHADLIKEGEWRLIHSVGSGTCQWAAQMAKIRGFKVIGTCSKGKKEVAESLDLDELIVLDEVAGKSYSNYESVDVVGRVMEITGNQGVKLVIDGVGKAAAEISVKCLALRGIWITFGNASGPVPPFSLLNLGAKSAFVTRPKLFDYVTTREELMERATEVFKWVKEGKLKVCVDQVFPLDKAIDCHSYLESGRSRGKLLLKVD